MTILKAAVPANCKGPSDDHRVRAVTGVDEGQENNTFFMRRGQSLEPAGGRALKTFDALVLAEDGVYAIANPLDQTPYATHVCGGDLPDAEPIMWNLSSLNEEPYASERLMRYARPLSGGRSRLSNSRLVAGGICFSDRVLVSRLRE